MATSGPIMIIGGGIGGTAAGVALAQRGIDSVVYERAPDLSRIHVGGSYVLHFGGVASLAQLGLAEKAHGLGHAIEHFEMATAKGRTIYSLPVGERGRELGVMPLAIRRADVLSVLTDALEDGQLQLGRTFRDAVQDSGGVTATFTDGRQERGSVLVGADGFDSTVRAHLHGRDRARYPGYAHWSGLAVDDGTTQPHVFRIMHGKGARFAYFHLGDGKVCWWCVRNAPEGPEGDGLGDPQSLAEFFGDWEDAQALLDATDQKTIHRRDTLDRRVIRRWGQGRITLMGDAAHAMTFNLGQGAGTSLTDAVSLADHLARGSVPETLRSYERLRARVTNPLLRMSAIVGGTAAWDWPLGPLLNVGFIRMGKRSTPGLLERDLKEHPAIKN